MNIFIRYYYTVRSIRNLAARFNRCATVEAILLDSANGKIPLPDKETCRNLAMTLAGVRAKNLPSAVKKN